MFGKNKKISELEKKLENSQKSVLELEKKIETLQKDTEESIAIGTPNDSKEVYGFYNGIIFALSFLKGEEAYVLQKPEKFNDEILSLEQMQEEKEKKIKNKRKNLKK